MPEEYNNGVPDRLRQVTAETMFPEVLYTLDTYPDVSPQDVMYIDESRAEGSGRRFDVEYGDGEIDGYDGIDDEIYNKDDEQVISAVIDYGDDREVKIWGDPTFFDAARYMAGLVDNESIENNGVSAGGCEIQDSVSDGGLQERVNNNSGTSSDSFYKRALNGLAKIVKARRK